MSHRLTASKLELADACPASHVLDWVADTSDAAERGTRIHEAIAKIPTLGVDEAVKGLCSEEERVVRAVADTPSVAPMLAAGAASLETALARDPETNVARVLGEGRGAYSEATTAEVVGTLDLFAVTDTHALDLDWKAGRMAVTRPRDNLQIGFGVMAGALVAGRDNALGMIAYCRDDEDAVVIEASFDMFDFAAVGNRIRDIIARIRAVEVSESKTYNRGEQCGHCPARTGCPAHVGLVKWVTRDVTAFRTEVGNAISLGAIQAAWAMAKDAEAAVKMLMQQIRGLAFYTPIPLDDGKFLAWSLGSERVKSGDVVHEVLTRELGAEAAELAISVETKVTSTKTAITKAMKGQTAKKKEAVWDALRKAGALVRKGGVREADAKDVAVPPSGPVVDATEGEGMA